MPAYTYDYTYDAKGNIASVSVGSNTTTYTYDPWNQLIREDNQAGGYTYVWTYDNAGNILYRTRYNYTTGTLGSIQETFMYTYGDLDWGDLLTAVNDQMITYDQIGNPLEYYNGYTFTWENGRRLSSLNTGSSTWNMSYNASGMRTGRTDGTTHYSYLYSGDLLRQMTVGDEELIFNYDVNGIPLSVIYGFDQYYYVTSLQGDVIAIVTSEGITVVEYAYDTWGNLLSITCTMESTLGQLNPLRYRGYVYDQETGFYYLQSRYYDPEIGRFLNADCQLYAGDLCGFNLFAYCGNNPVMNTDPNGEFFFTVLGGISGFISGVVTALMTEEAPTLKSVLKNAKHSAIGGAIAGLGIDIGLAIIAEGGGAALPIVGACALSYIMGGAGNLYTSYATSDNGISGDKAIGTFIVGGTFNCLSLGTGLGTMASTFSGMWKQGMEDLAENLIIGIFIGISTSIATEVGTLGLK